MFDYNTDKANNNNNIIGSSPQRDPFFDDRNMMMNSNSRRSVMGRRRRMRPQNNIRDFSSFPLGNFPPFPSSRRSEQPSSYDNYFSSSNQELRRAEMPSPESPTGAGLTGDEFNRHAEPPLGMYSSNSPASPSDSEIADLLRNDKDLRQLARSMPAGTKVGMHEGKGEELGQARDLMSR